MTQSSWVGKTLGDRYQIEDLLGQGGMSAVYKATDPNLKRVVAVKMIHPHLSADTEFVRRFEEEATAVAQLRHPNIVQVYDFNQDDDVYYMVLEFVPGETLQDRLRRINADGRRLSLTEAANYTINICNATEYAHKRGMIHRDIKPANVMLDIHNQAILMDFGIAKIVGSEQHTATGAVIGTALYMAPEQIRGEKIDDRVDVYAIGVTLFEMLNGNPPYEADSAMTLMMKHLNDPIPDLRDLQPDIPEDLVAVVEKTLSKDRNQRYESSAEMEASLQQVLDRIESGTPLVATAAIATELQQDGTPIAGTTISSGAPTTVASQDEIVQPVDGGIARIVGAAVGAADTADAVAPTVAVPQSDSPDSAANQVDADIAAPTAALQDTSVPNKPNWALIGGGIALVFIMLCAIVGGVLAFGQFSENGNDGKATQTALALALLDTEIASESAETQDPTETVILEEHTAVPTEAHTPAPLSSPTQTVPPGIPYIRINDIALDDQGVYQVDYETFEFSEQMVQEGYHMTFFFDETPSDQVGQPFETNYYMFHGPSPFDNYKNTMHSDAATQMCVLVTNPDHTVIPESGNCFSLPEASAVLEAQLSADNADQVSPTPLPTLQTTEKPKKEPGY